MSQPAILLPVFVQAFLTFGLLIWTAQLRVAAVSSGRVRVKDIVLGQNAWPAKAQQVGRAYQNQLETPVVFYLVVVLAIIDNQADALFVALRAAHALVHTGGNDLRRRFGLFLASTTILATMWLLFAVRIFVAG